MKVGELTEAKEFAVRRVQGRETSVRQYSEPAILRLKAFTPAEKKRILKLEVNSYLKLERHLDDGKLTMFVSRNK